MRRDTGADRSVQRNAGWLTVATVSVGVTNFGYALLLTWLLPIGDYVRYAGVQGLLLVCGTAAAASIPWVLTRRVGTADRRGLERVVSFSVAITVLQGLVAAIIVGGIAAGILPGAMPWVAAAAAAASVFSRAGSSFRRSRLFACSKSW
jgi:O-antigen/teichoic acid export membrane protein